MQGLGNLHPSATRSHLCRDLGGNLHPSATGSHLCRDSGGNLHPSATTSQDSREGSLDTSVVGTYHLPARGTGPSGWRSCSDGCTGRNQCYSLSSRQWPSAHSHRHQCPKRHISAVDGAGLTPPTGRQAMRVSEAQLGSGVSRGPCFWSHNMSTLHREHGEPAMG